MRFLYGAGRLGKKSQDKRNWFANSSLLDDQFVARCCCILKLGNDDNVVWQSVGGVGGALGLVAECVFEPRVRQDLSGARSSRRVLGQAGGNLNNKVNQANFTKQLFLTTPHSSLVS